MAHAGAMHGRMPSHIAGLAALVVGAAAVVAAPAALLALALLGANALVHARRVTMAPLAGPLLGGLIAYSFVGSAAAIGVLLAWRVLADARWSMARARDLAMTAGHPIEAKQRALAHAWATPLYGLALVAYSAPHMVAGLPLDLPHVPLWVPLATGAAAALLVFDWALRRAADWRLGDLAAAPAAHLLWHHVLFLLAFGLTLDVSAGIVAMAAWRLLHAAPLPSLARQASFTAVP